MTRTHFINFCFSLLNNETEADMDMIMAAINGVMAYYKVTWYLDYTKDLFMDAINNEAVAKDYKLFHVYCIFYMEFAGSTLVRFDDPKLQNTGL